MRSAYCIPFDLTYKKDNTVGIFDGALGRKFWPVGVLFVMLIARNFRGKFRT